MSTHLITLEVDEGWLQTLKNVTQEVWDGEVCRWIGEETK